jgi:hypothetical protein
MSTSGPRRGSIGLARVLALSATIVCLAISRPAMADPPCGKPGSAPCPGTLLTTYYDVSGSIAQSGSVDNILQLINPVGNANPEFGSVQNLCAMIYVFDRNENMGECCGCPLSPQKFLSLSVENNLLSNWGHGKAPSGGAIDIIAANPDRGCDPAAVYSPARELNGYILHGPVPVGVLAEVPLQDAGDAPNATLSSLIKGCATLTANRTGSTGTCSCTTIIGGGS